jgi:hypothetical protein
MPLQNRVSPSGELLVTPARGTFMGNRGGALHNDRREIVREYASRRWITCVLEFKGRRRVVMSPRRYTELFFLDEAVALAAGHRPCSECRRMRFNEFRRSWVGDGSPLPSADAMDLELHPARIGRQKEKVTYRAELRALPDGCFVRIDDQIDGAMYLVWEHALFRWTPDRYAERREMDDKIVTVLTPEPIVRCLRNGYRPEVHHSVV